MKIDKRNPGHWVTLLLFFVQCGLGVLACAVRRRPRGGSVILYGHRLNGNLLALYTYMAHHPETDLRPVFLTMDRDYAAKLRTKGFDVVLATGFGCARLLGSACALVSDHGLHSLQIWRGVCQKMGLRFFDVWHGIPFKGFSPDDFRVQHRYNETWVASALHRDLYVERFGFAKNVVVVTGYARTDQLVRAHPENKAAIRRQLGLPPDRRLVLFAPTWKQDHAARKLFPFDCDAQVFVARIADIAAEHDADVVLRTHLNSGEAQHHAHSHVHHLPASRCPDTEAVLQACDILICDWSSIAFDFLLLDRPAIFLDVAPPFRKGFSLGPEYRYGAVVGCLDSLAGTLQQVLERPDAYWQTYGDHHRRIRQAVYGGLDDGDASQRCVRRLLRIVRPGSSL